jgi:hypothetical protein
MNPIAILKRHFANVERSRQLLEEIRDGIANLTDVTNRHLVKLTETIEVATDEARRADARLEPLPEYYRPVLDRTGGSSNH